MGLGEDLGSIDIQRQHDNKHSEPREKGNPADQVDEKPDADYQLSGLSKFKSQLFFLELRGRSMRHVIE